ncbi:restriction endonuclease [Clostridium butyricum]|uniref:restriction endonuclease n=1 Tax=Clostridium butyricum TaxID=1492 RepID=UPI0024B8F7C5|nr:restriction endonuclease [Clostridium butyricum]
MILKGFIKVFFYFEIMILFPLISLEAYLLFSNGKHYDIYRIRSRYIRFIINFNKDLIKTIVELIRRGERLLTRLSEEIIKYIQDFYYRENIKKIDFESFCRGIEGMTPGEFEEFTANLYLGLGYKVKLMPPGPDGGKDVILIDDKGFIYVECKRYLTSVVGREICQKLIGAAVGDEIKRTILFTCGKIHENAYEYVEKLNKGYNEVNLEIVDLDKMYNLYIKSKVSDKELKLNI